MKEEHMAHRGNKWAASREIRLETSGVRPIVRRAVTAPDAVIAATEHNTAASGAELCKQVADFGCIIERDLCSTVTT